MCIREEIPPAFDSDILSLEETETPPIPLAAEEPNTTDNSDSEIETPSLRWLERQVEGSNTLTEWQELIQPGNIFSIESPNPESDLREETGIALAIYYQNPITNNSQYLAYVTLETPYYLEEESIIQAINVNSLVNWAERSFDPDNINSIASFIETSNIPFNYTNLFLSTILQDPSKFITLIQQAQTFWLGRTSGSPTTYQSPHELETLALAQVLRSIPANSVTEVYTDSTALWPVVDH